MTNKRDSESYLPMSETAYYILLSLHLQQGHGYKIMQDVETLTQNRIHLGAGTLYGTLGKMESGGLITVIAEENKRKVYEITDFGREVLQLEITRIRELYENSKGVRL